MRLVQPPFTVAINALKHHLKQPVMVLVIHIRCLAAVDCVLHLVRILLWDVLASYVCHKVVREPVVLGHLAPHDAELVKVVCNIILAVTRTLNRVIATHPVH